MLNHSLECPGTTCFRSAFLFSCFFGSIISEQKSRWQIGKKACPSFVCFFVFLSWVGKSDFLGSFMTSPEEGGRERKNDAAGIMVSKKRFRADNRGMPPMPRRKQIKIFHVGIQYSLRAALFEQICSQRADPTPICFLLFCGSAFLTKKFNANLKGEDRKTKKQIENRSCWDTLL